MKQFALDKTVFQRKLLLALMALTISVFSLFATAAQSDTAEKNGKMQTEQPAREFNHMTTGFPLTGAHAIAECGTCHVGGIFKGTPRNCSGCHAKGKRVVATAMSLKHIVTTEPCEVCHTNTVTFLGAKFNHGTAKAGSCATCHNSLIATGKPSSHSGGMKATDSCEKCHRTFAWLPSTFNHASVVPGTCATCHNGASAIGKPASTHGSGLRATESCDTCHRTSGWLPAFYNHANVVPGTCATCHNGNPLTGKPASHSFGLKVTATCDTCHRTTGWLPSFYNHAAVVAGTCATCHNGVSATNKPANHTGSRATMACDKCHTTAAWLPAGFNHIGVVAGTCATCHEAQRPTSHASKGYIGSCDSCHAIGSNWAFNHAAQQGKHTCYTCHAARGQKEHGALAATTYRNCDQCHTTSTWNR